MLGGIGIKLHAVNIPGQVRIQRSCQGIQIGGYHRVAVSIHDRAAVRVKRIIGKDILGEEIRTQIVEAVFIRQVVQREGYAVLAGSLRVIAQLGFHLAVSRIIRVVFSDFAVNCRLIHEDNDVGVHDRIQVGKAGTLLHDAVVRTGFLFDQRTCGGHHQALQHLALAQVELGCIVSEVRFSVELRQDADDTGQLRSRHRGTGHVLVLIGSAGRGVCGALRTAVHRIDVAAGGRDLRFDGQIFRNTIA